MNEHTICMLLYKLVLCSNFLSKFKLKTLLQFFRDKTHENNPEIYGMYPKLGDNNMHRWNVHQNNQFLILTKWCETVHRLN